MSRKPASTTKPATWVVIPVKPFGQGKSRLAPHLSQEERASLSRSLLARVLAATAAAGCFAGRLVVSRDPEALEMAQAAGALPVPEVSRGLNLALRQGADVAIWSGAEALLVLPADLPNVSADVLRALLDDTPEADGVLIAPSATGGTNALWLRPPNAIPFAFGEQSAARHTALAQESGRPVRLFQSAALALDVDLPSDLPADLHIDMQTDLHPDLQTDSPVVRPG